jgi:NitT/TauT family transport system permease protein
MASARRGVQDILAPLALAGAALLAWELLVRSLRVPQGVLPAPSVVLELFGGPQAQLVFDNAGPTGLQAVAGFLAAALLGIAVAVAIAYSQWLKEAAYPYLIAFQVIPKIAFAPIFVLWFGIGFRSRFAFATFICFFPIVIALITGLRDTSADLVRMSRAYGASKAQVFLHVRFPSSLPYLFSGLKIAATLSMIGVVIGEFITADRGLGYLILYASSRADTPLVLAAIAVLCAIGLAIYGAVVAAEAWVMRRMGAE